MRDRTVAPIDCQESSRWTQLAPDLFLFPDACNVYLLRTGDRAVVVDAGTGAWATHLDELGDGLGIRHIDGIVLTHADRDQCCALYREPLPEALRGVFLLAPAGDAQRLRDPLAFWQTYQTRGCPDGYAAPLLPIQPDAVIGADSERVVGGVRFCAVATPGHTRRALSYVVDWHSKQLVFCGDAAHEGGTLTGLFQLEWDHWTPEGALAAWYGLERLAGNRIDRLLPSHGQPVRGGAAVLRRLQKRLLSFVSAKTAVAPGAASRWADGQQMACGALRLSEHLVAVGGNGFAVIDRDSVLLVDPTQGDLPAIQTFLDKTGLRPDVATATHYHIDHTDALNDVRQRWGADVWLHPRVAEPVLDRNRFDVPWLPPDSIQPDRTLPMSGRFRWRSYRFGIRPFPGQTWWHCAFDTPIDGRHVLFSGDNFQPMTRWNGTGGFCAYNGSRFTGFAESAQVVLDMKPDLICNGHRCIYHFDEDHYQRIPDWCSTAQKATDALCPSDAWLADYDPRAFRWEPFVHRAAGGDELSVSFVHTNHHTTARRIVVRPVPRAGFTWSPARRTMTVPAGQSRKAGFTLQVDAAHGRHIVAADVEQVSRTRAEAAVLLIDID